ncbi:unnamed protein product [Clonostachys solani]|uniref:Uncharacterized protein n=1 Tax=Clonostachys solani TaxID=160281 RepID=A0A9N9Z4L7_9HYPO|nr:unnamed protein product [Clonostachys solani]
MTSFESYLSCSFDAGAQQLHAVSSVIAGSAFVELLEIDGMFESAVLDQRPIRDMLIVLGKAHHEAEADLGIGVEFAGAELDDIAHAFGRAVLALDAVIGGRTVEKNQDSLCFTDKAMWCGSRSDIRESEVDLVMDSHHGWENQFPKGILRKAYQHHRFAGPLALPRDHWRAYSCIWAFTNDVRLQRHQGLLVYWAGFWCGGRRLKLDGEG